MPYKHRIREREGGWEWEKGTMVKKSASIVKNRVHEYMLYEHDIIIQMVYVSKGTDYLVRN